MYDERNKFLKKWANNYWLYIIGIVLLFFISIFIFAFLSTVFFQSITLFIILIALHLVAEVYLFNVNDAVWIYRKHKEDINELVIKSIEFKTDN